jgi:polygalacturonase
MDNDLYKYGNDFNLISPPAAQTDTTIAIIWDKQARLEEFKCYEIYLDNKCIGTSVYTDYTISDLRCDWEYEIYVQAVTVNNAVAMKSDVIRVKTRAIGEFLDVISYGALGDGQTLNTEAIQRAIDECSHGGVVYIPEGTFVTGALFLKSNMTLYLDEKALLLGSKDIVDYPLTWYRYEGLETTCYASLINTKYNRGKRLENIIIEGLGIIDASGCELRRQASEENKGKPGRAICLRNVDGVYLKDFTVKQSPAWCIHLIYCNGVSANRIKVSTKWDDKGNSYNIPNGDGLNPDSSSNIYIFNSDISSQDDCIAIKSGRGEEGRQVGILSENIRITNCRFMSGFGVAVGSEMSGGVRNVLVQDCEFNNTYSLASVKAPRTRGGTIENIRYEDITFHNNSTEHKDCKWFRGAIYIDQFYSQEAFDLDSFEEVNEGTSTIRGITFCNIELQTVAGNAIYMAGLPENCLNEIRLENINAIGKYGLKAMNINGLELINVIVTSKEDESYLYHNIN